MVKEGHLVTALTGKPSYRPAEESERQGVDSIQIPKAEWKGVVGTFLYGIAKLIPNRYFELDKIFGINVVRTYTYSPRLREGIWRLMQRMVQYLTFFFTSFFTALFLPKQDAVIYLSTPPLLNGVTAYFLKILKGSVCLYNIQDLYPDVAVKLGAIKNPLIIKACGILESHLYRNSAVLIPVGDKMSKILLKKGVNPDKIEVIYNWMDTNLIKPVGKDTPFSRERDLVDKFVVMYSGNMGLSQGLETVLECARITRDKPIDYLMIGGGANRDQLMEMAEQWRLNNVRFLPYQPKEKLSESLGSADIHLVPLKSGLSNYSVPSKVYGIMASGKPIVASVDEDSEIASIVAKAGCGLVVEPENARALAEAISTLYHDTDKLDKLGQRGREYLEKTITREISTRRYMEAIYRVTD